MGNLCLSNETINVRLKRINLVKDVAQTKENIIGTTRTSISQQKKTIKQKSMILDSKPSSNRIESRYNRKIFEFINPNRFNLNRSSELLRTLMRLQSISDITDCFKLNYKIFEDQKRIKTSTQKDIVQQISFQPFTREKIEEIKQNPNRLPADTALILMPPFSEFDRIVPGVYQTSVTGIVSETMRENRIRLIINATYEMPLLKNPEFISIRVPIEDDPQEMILEYFDDVADLLEFVRLKGYCSVVHCMAGVSRSAALILAYLIKYTHSIFLKHFCISNLFENRFDRILVFYNN
ncbi:Dual specificity protein phosphatase 14 [Sarcoptes scabiei]|uniref:protein-serine/threonine phosphatase n=1 Tax=Sarcoptes scabiei TaxID=52283 RepID=A0A834VHU8_SARSC|nr:Dual specificity protein phosphatase 14 [Sarcoptes scabiei]